MEGTLNLPPVSNSDAWIKFAVRLFKPFQEALILVAGRIPIFDDVVKQFPDHLLELRTSKGLQCLLILLQQYTKNLDFSLP